MKIALVAALLLLATAFAGTALADHHQEEPLVDLKDPTEPRCDDGESYVCTGPCQLGAGPVWMRVYCV